MILLWAAHPSKGIPCRDAIQIKISVSWERLVQTVCDLPVLKNRFS